MKLGHVAMLLGLMFVAIWASNNVQFIKRVTG